LKRQHALRFTIHFHTSGRLVNRLHFERSNRDNRNHRYQEGEDQPLVLAQNNEIVEEMRLTPHLLPWKNGGSGNHRKRISAFPVAGDESGCFFHSVKAVLY